MIDVVSAVIVRDGRILLTQRRANQDFPFTWESPGGAVEDGEHHHVALRRELDEELGLPIKNIDDKPMWVGEFKNETSRPARRHVRVLMYACEIVGNCIPAPREDQGIGWFNSDELSHLRLTPANDEALGHLLLAVQHSLPPVDPAPGDE